MNSVDLPHGVRSPVVTHTHPYPTRYHGGIWTRPVFGLPWVRTPFAVYRPSQLNGTSIVANYTPIEGTRIDRTFAPYKGLGNEGGWDVGSGVFRRPAYDGGGVFNAVSGLGAIPPAVVGVGIGAVVGFAVVALILKR